MDSRKVADDIFLEAMRETRFVFSKEGMQGACLKKEEVVEIDLHGYTVEKALAKVEEMILWKKNHESGTVHLIVGEGKHSSRYTSSIRQEVQNYLDQCGAAYHVEKGVIRL